MKVTKLRVRSRDVAAVTASDIRKAVKATDESREFLRSNRDNAQAAWLHQQNWEEERRLLRAFAKQREIVNR